SELERMADVKTITGAFTGAYVEHPFTKQPIPVWIGDYVLAGYGTGAVMSVPCGDQRDYDFAKHFKIPIPNIFSPLTPKGGTEAQVNLIADAAFTEKSGFVFKNSDFLDGLSYKQATKKVIEELEKIGQGKGKTNYRLRDAVFSRQRYWGEPFPVYYVNGMPQMIDEKHLPIELPEVEKYLPTETGEPPLGNATVWAWDTKNNKIVSNELVAPSAVEGPHNGVYPLELNTMPGWAGSSQYFNRYMDPHNDNEIFSQEAINYWQQVDLYIGGSEHATGHLLYSRFWQKFMFDKGLVPVDEYAKKLINQGMILGMSAFLNKLNVNFFHKSSDNAIPFRFDNVYISNGFFTKMIRGADIKNRIQHLFSEEDKIYLDDEKYVLNYVGVNEQKHVHVSFVNASDELDIEAFKNWRPEYQDAEFICEEDGTFKVLRYPEKMSKSKYNVVNPDQICHDYGADSLRLYEMFLGPLEQAKPWNTAGITGVHGFLKKLWRLYHQGDDINKDNPKYYLHDPKTQSAYEAFKVVKRGFGVTDTEPTKENLKTLHKTIKKVEEDIENFSFNTSVSTFMIAVNELTLQECKSKAIL
ncbi:MAG TPA: class I tRNA ligase family protein, partial [Flavobacteriaceae bacterium]